MGARFDGASSQRLSNSTAQVTAYPFSVGMWVRPQSQATVQRFWAVADTASTNQLFSLGQSTTTWRLAANAGGTPANIDWGTISTFQWVYLVGRFISATNRRGAALESTGVVAHGQSTTSRTPTSLDTVAIGAIVNSSPAGFFTGHIAEYWLTNTDIQPDGEQLQDSTLRQLAMCGPFSLPHIAKDIVEYRSFRSRLDSSQDTPDEVHYRGTRPVWTNTNGVTLGVHPPAASTGLYRGPIDYRPPMVLV